MALASVRTFRALQEERVYLYRNFEEGFVAYLKVRCSPIRPRSVMSSWAIMHRFMLHFFIALLQAAPNLDFEAYKRLVHEISREFNRISQLIICEKETLKTVHGRKGTYAMIPDHFLKC